MTAIQSQTHLQAVGDIALSSGAHLPAVQVAYEQYGHLSPAGDNAVIVCHALTGSARAAGEQGWWDPLIGPGAAIDTNRFAVFCPNILGSCYGTTGPTTPDPLTGRPYGGRFPEITIADMVTVQRRLLEGLGVKHVVTAAGGSLGGLQVLEWAVQAPGLLQTIIPIATGLSHSAWNIAFNECARQAIRNDPAFHGGEYLAHDTFPAVGLSLARMVAMVSYRSAPSFEERFERHLAGPADFLPGTFQVESYLHYQGQKLVERFDANSYLRITEAMDHFDVGEGRGGAAAALAPFRGPALVMGIDSDILYPTWQQAAVVDALRANGNRVDYREITSLHGHDAFLMEWDQMSEAIRDFLATV